MNLVWQQTLVIGAFMSSGLCALLRWLHPATVSLTTFSLLFLASWVGVAMLIHSKNRE